MIRPALLGAVVAGVATAALAKMSLPKWDRPSYSGSTVSLTGGAASAAGAVVASAVSGDIPATIAGAAGAVAGYVDDHHEDSFSTMGKGFKGHLGALARGDITSGAVKILGVGAGAAVSGWCVASRSRGVTRLCDAALNTVLIASSANVVNLFDLRPGRALKVALATAVPLGLSGDKAALAVAGSSVASLPTDLHGDTMLGDLGANALGAQLGVALARRLPLGGRLAVTAVVVGMMYVSEKVSFSKVIDECAPLRFIDQLGRP
ncbi:hypothetical protein J2S49_000011 [Arcanobacterium wilhelmae]|uniref:Uncharacterized protein n=1 Tax=Arcanobacterium wilhelmae TaxID=1803177 RepID=A0ABT9N8U3_9ACTO|nr:hypothetical protein [Arcanobacterium wilhelmae]MDP9799935.1 hypothetical protein [Arcanobacterium wilhelmae]WFN91070.1 hypothetical protein P8A24_04270 [Arcanobacterium wilhelmae]